MSKFLKARSWLYLNWTMMTDLIEAGIYIHIPFCVKKCKYCDFLSAPGDSECIREYVSALVKGIRSYKEAARKFIIKTVYVGGGTPSVLSAPLIEEIINALKDTFIFCTQGLEFTMEVNPGTVDLNKLKSYRMLGINRLSIGVQSADDKELKLMGRIHTFGEACECVKAAREAGFTNISCDIISALPGQTLEDYKDNLKKIVGLKPEHISSYSLIVEPGTEFERLYGDKGPYRDKLPSEEVDREMYSLTMKMLKEAGYERYEISNYSKPGYESRHNSSYWTGTDYFGIGLGASSLLENVRYKNVSDLKEYISSPELKDENETEILKEKDRMSEYMILGLRMTKGVSIPEFEKRFGLNIFDVFGGEIRKNEKLSVLKCEKDRIFLTEYGLDVSNAVLSDFVF